MRAYHCQYPFTPNGTNRPALLSPDGRLRPLTTSSIFYQSRLGELVFAGIGITNAPTEPYRPLRRKFSLESPVGTLSTTNSLWVLPDSAAAPTEAPATDDDATLSSIEAVGDLVRQLPDLSHMTASQLQR